MTTVSSGTLAVSSGQTSDGVIVLSGGQLNVLSGGTILNTFNSGGTDVVSSGGTAIGTTVSSGGDELISGGSSVSAIISAFACKIFSPVGSPAARRSSGLTLCRVYSTSIQPAQRLVPYSTTGAPRMSSPAALPAPRLSTAEASWTLSLGGGHRRHGQQWRLRFHFQRWHGSYDNSQQRR
jgi:autotransporter passenger strand-loop-strand repeat protein